jgi:hypothetical protein
MAFGEVNFPSIAPGPGFNAMLGRVYDEMGNVQQRNKVAFGYYEDEKKREQDAYMRQVQAERHARDLETTNKNDASRREAKAKQEYGRVSAQAAAEALMNDPKRKALLASAGRTYPGAMAQAPSAQNTLADFYEYGAGNPQGRGGGANSRIEGGDENRPAEGRGAGGFDPEQIQNCYSDPMGPGCPGLIAMYEAGQRR